jgi:flagellar biosynthesis chaperone FliJ
MKLENERQVQATRRKLALLETRYNELETKPYSNASIQAATLRSLKQFINQLKEEIALYECHATIGARGDR